MPIARTLRIACCLCVVTLAACPHVQVPELVTADKTPPPNNQPLKVHMRSGQLLLLTSWSDAPGDSGLVGAGQRYDLRRYPLGPFNGRVPRDSIALLEITHQRTAHPAGSIILGTFTTVMGAITIACLADPKSCFGSCPTFYADTSQDRPVAEGFSGSVARALEATDVDDLADVHPAGPTVTLTMRNEALETHAVRSVRLLAVARRTGALIAQDGAGRLFAVADPAAPGTCRSTDGECRDRVAARDGAEWMSRADSTDLGRRDSIDLAFAPRGGPTALLVTARQSFVSTYVFYQMLAWAGSHAGDLLAAVERGGTAAFPGAWAVMGRLGHVEVLVQDAGGAFRPAGSFGEPGPIAADRQIVALPETAPGESLRVRLRFARGAWRFDQVAAVALGAMTTATALEPVRVERGGRPDSLALARLVDPDRYLVTYPGDRYELVFALPGAGRDYALFLESRGYYYEWMRPEWLREENPGLLALMARDDEQALRRMAPGYARLEPRLEAMFWSSRFGRQP